MRPKNQPPQELSVRLPNLKSEALIMCQMLFSILGVTSAVVFLSSAFADEIGPAKTIDRDSLSSRSYKTWLCVYKFSEDKVVRIDGQKDFHILIYKCPGIEGEYAILDFATLSEDGKKLRLLRETDLKINEPLIFEGIDVLPDESTVEIIVRWEIPGQGRERQVEKYHYNSTSIEWIESAALINDGRTAKWIKRMPH